MGNKGTKISRAPQYVNQLSAHYNLCEISYVSVAGRVLGGLEWLILWSESTLWLDS